MDYPKLRGRQYIFDPKINDGLCVLLLLPYIIVTKWARIGDISKLVNTQGWCLNYAKTSIDEFPITGDKLTLLEKKNKVSLCLSDRIRMELLCPCAIRVLRNLRILCANY